MKNELSKYYHDAKVLELLDKYESAGFEVKRDVKVGNYEVDIVVVDKDKEKKFIEVKVGSSSKAAIQKYKRLREYIRNQEKSKFELIFAGIPRRKDIYIDDFESKLFEYLMDNFPDELDVLSTHSKLDEIVDVDITDISIYPQQDLIEIQGSCSIEISMQYGSCRETSIDDLLYDAFEADFKVKTDLNYDIEECIELHIDTRKFYE